MSSMWEVEAEGREQYERWVAEQAERLPVEGPFTYASGWQGRYDPNEGLYLGMDDVYMPREFDPQV